MRLLFLADAVFEDLPGGSRVVARELARRLAERGHEITFLVGRQNANSPADEQRGPIRIVRYEGAGNAREFVRQGREACARLWAEKPFDHVHTHFAYAAIGPLQAVPAHAPHVRSFYGPWDEEGWVQDTTPRPGPLGMVKARAKRLVRRRVEAANLRRSKAVIVLSQHSLGEVRAFGYPDQNVCLSAGGTDTERFVPAKDKAVVRQSLGLPQDRRILFTVRRLAPRMGLDNLLKAMPQIIARCPDVLLLIGGKGPEKARLEGLIESLDLKAHARLIGFIPDDQLVAQYQAADLFVLPTLALEGFGLVTTEALACGVPVVGTSAGATPEILRDLDPRLVAPGVTSDALASAILEFLEGGWAEGLTPERVRGLVLEKYTWDKHTDAVEAIYQKLA